MSLYSPNVGRIEFSDVALQDGEALGGLPMLKPGRSCRVVGLL